MTRPRLLLALVLVYLGLSGNLEPANLVVGALIAAAVIALLPLPRRAVGTVPLRTALPALLRYLAGMPMAMMRSGIGVARIVLDPALPLHPGIVAIPSGSESPLETALSAHAISITPGQLVLEIDTDGVMFTHYLDITGTEAQADEEQRQRRELLQRIVG